jgi:type I restriction enzyme, S subunit
MRSNNQALGKYIQEVVEINSNFSVNNLRGISSVYKNFIKSKANIVGVDFLDYKIVRNGQFAFNPNTARMGDKIPIALNTAEDCIVSKIYPVFQVTNTEELLPEYLMMWFRRPEFDRYARFMSHGSAREVFEWDAMCETTIPIPAITKQREIVSEYNAIQNRLELNRKLIKTLEDSAEALYKQWFIKFEFPDNHGKPYQSSGGEMLFSEEFEKDLPMGWSVGTLEEIATQKMGYAFDGEKYEANNGITVLRGENVSERFLRWDNRKKWNEKIIDRMGKCLIQEHDVVIGMDGSKVGKNWAMVSKYDLPLLLAQRVSCLRAKIPTYQNFIYYSMCTLDFVGYVSQVQTGTSIPHISGQQIFDFPILIPPKNVVDAFDSLVSKMISHKENITRENQYLENFKSLLLSRLASMDS